VKNEHNGFVNAVSLYRCRVILAFNGGGLLVSFRRCCYEDIKEKRTENVLLIVCE
jgi:hypothetical protein